MKISLLIFAITSVLLLVSCEEHKEKKHKKKEKEEMEATTNETSNSKDANPSINCDTSLWRFVYDPTRLQAIDYCKTVTGVIEESNADEDGDQHMLLKLDAGQEDLLTKKNMKKKQGDLVIEAVCANKTKLAKVGTTCNGYVNHIQLPKVGDHVKVTGSLVRDMHNGWNEIHPITRVELIK
ncbi:hypothetical protein [Flavisolibacter nicotianae]|uniref:hypothetical protein n=1 Tax=Flavisolibacter nicotianae TaxID=2364882 RepID=UPI000EB03723|nr:hypothetical protein [Flavisolibacter nicotianae]